MNLTEVQQTKILICKYLNNEIKLFINRVAPLLSNITVTDLGHSFKHSFVFKTYKASNVVLIIIEHYILFLKELDRKYGIIV